MNTTENENIEIRLLLEAIHLKYGYDFRRYAQASVKRRIHRRLERSGLHSISEMQHEVLCDTAFFEALLLDLSINVTEMFRDPSFFSALREHVLPALAGQPFIKIWHAGCSTGEEVYSMAILLKEMGLDAKTRIYATDVNEVVLKKAREGIFAIDQIKKHTANYQKAGGTESFGDYYAAHYDSVIMDKSLKENIVFADHNLVTDAVFGEMDMIVCRNVMIYFNRELQDRVFQLFCDSLCDEGFLCIGSKESVRFSTCESHFESVVDAQKIYRKKRLADPGQVRSTPESRSRSVGAQP
jgi:chemotaxis protein methyltransferase CheR